MLYSKNQRERKHRRQKHKTEYISCKLKLVKSESVSESFAASKANVSLLQRASIFPSQDKHTSVCCK